MASGSRRISYATSAVSSCWRPRPRPDQEDRTDADLPADRCATALKHYRSARRRAHTAPDVSAYHVALEAALAEVDRLAGLILAAPARTPSALRAKAAAMAWELGDDIHDGIVMDAFRAKALRGLLADLAIRR